MDHTRLSAGELVAKSLGLVRDELGGVLRAILTFAIPANLALEYLAYHVFGPEDVVSNFRASSVILGLVAPLQAAAVFAVADAAARQEAISQRDLLGAAFRTWGRVFAAQIVAGILIVLGFVLFIVPGVVLAVRYALVEIVAFEEGARPGRARERSRDLVSGNFWPVFWLLVFSSMLAVLSALANGAVAGAFPEHDNFVVSAAFDCLCDLFYGLTFVGAWVLYHQKRTQPAGFGGRPEPIG